MCCCMLFGHHALLRDLDCLLSYLLYYYPYEIHCIIAFTCNKTMRQNGRPLCVSLQFCVAKEDRA
jgi:hypothetical protein